VPKIGHDQTLSDALMPLSSGSPLAAEPVMVGGKIYLLRLKEREKLDDKEFMAKKDMLKGILLNVKKNECVASWIENSRAALIKEGKLKYTRDVKSL
jgi:peptidyl-prolyl cis-trans isomerase D